MTIEINQHELGDRNVWQDNRTLIDICNHVEGFSESDYKHISDGLLKILREEKLIKVKETTHKNCILVRGLKVFECMRCGRKSSNYSNGVLICNECCDEFGLCVICGKKL